MRCIRIFTARWPDCRNRAATPFDLQLFNQEKTEDATPKKREEARKKGQVAKSMEINSAVVILAAFFALQVLGAHMYDQLQQFTRFIFSNLGQNEITVSFCYELFLGISLLLAKTVLPVMLAIMAAGLMINFYQAGFMLTLEPLLPTLGKMNPIAGAKRMVSKKALVELLKSLFKIAVIGYFIWRFLSKETPLLPRLINTGLGDAVAAAVSLLFDLVYQISAVMIVLAILDLMYQRWDHSQSLKMSKQEVKEEFKQTEGDPQIKGKIKERQRAMAMRRMMQDVPKADVVVTNPTHFAVALKYEAGMTAPLVLAKGRDLMAQRIRDAARRANVTVVENKPLARALYATTEIGDVVPPDLYKAVAEVLAYVYRLKKKIK